MKTHDDYQPSCRWPLLALLLALALLGAPWSNAQAQQGPTVQPASTANLRVTTSAVGPQGVTLAVTGSGLETLGGYEFDLDVDPAVTRATGAQVGSFLGQSGRTVGILGPLLGAQGETLALGAYSYGTAGGASGSGTLALVDLQVVGEGVSPLDLHGALLVDTQANVLSVDTADGALQARRLASGWNLVSIAPTLASTAITQALASIAGGYDLIYAYDACNTADPWLKYDPQAPPFVNDLSGVDERHSYWLRATQAITLTLVGTPPVTATLPLCPGWNLIGYPSATARAVEDALASIAGRYDLVYTYDAADAGDPWKKFDPAAPPFVNDLAELEPGKGYWLRVTQAVTLTVTP